MKKILVQKSIFGLVLAAAAGGVFGQADSGSIPPLRGTPNRLPLSMQELQIIPPANVNNITNVIRVVQPNTYTVTNSSYGQTTTGAAVDCGGGVLTGGGGTCNDNSGLVAVAASQPNGNGWYVGCQSLNYQGIAATVYAVCSRN